MLALSGEIRTVPGAVKIKGDNAGNLPPNERRMAGLVAGPEERLGHAAAPDMSLVENALLTGVIRKGLAKKGFIDWAATRAYAEDIIKTFDVRTPGSHVAARALSGGNLQKFVIGREILQAPDVIIVNQPTWGVDAAAAAFIRQALLDRAAAGAAVIVISQDIDELLEVADSFAALNGGRLSEPVPTKGLTVGSDRFDAGRGARDAEGRGAACMRDANFLPRKLANSFEGICRAKGVQHAEA